MNVLRTSGEDRRQISREFDAEAPFAAANGLAKGLCRFPGRIASQRRFHKCHWYDRVSVDRRLIPPRCA